MYLSIGVSEEKFWDSTPYDLEPYHDDYKLKQWHWVTLAWQYILYSMCAVQSAVATVLVGKISKAKYLDKPFLQDIQEEQEKGENLSEAEKKRQREKLLMTLQLMQANFELNHSNDDEGRQD